MNMNRGLTNGLIARLRSQPASGVTWKAAAGRKRKPDTSGARSWIRRAVLLISACCVWLAADSGSKALVYGGTGTAHAQSAFTVSVDPGHQRYSNPELEQTAPGSSEGKPKVSSGTQGVVTGKPEYEVNLEVALKLKPLLEAKGMNVVMTRDTHEVDISNAERAELANQAGADLAVRLHADGNPSPCVKGISVLYPGNKHAGTQPIAADSRQAAELVLAELIGQTGASSRGTVPRDDLTGFNWSKVPVILVEMGFMSNPDEDKLLSDPEYQDKLAEGLAEGIMQYRMVKEAQLASVAVDEAVDLTDVTPLYEEDAAGMQQTPYALEPQQVDVVARRGGWYKIITWLGELWIYLRSSLGASLA